jgi:hypothetical protein
MLNDAVFYDGDFGENLSASCLVDYKSIQKAKIGDCP